MAKLTLKFEFTDEELEGGFYNSTSLSIDNIGAGCCKYEMLRHFNTFLKALTYTIPEEDSE